jgi:hypothetical protein
VVATAAAEVVCVVAAVATTAEEEGEEVMGEVLSAVDCQLKLTLVLARAQNISARPSVEPRSFGQCAVTQDSSQVGKSGLW